MERARAGFAESDQARSRNEHVRQLENTDTVNPLAIGLSGGLPRADEVWRQFTADGRYRIAGASDFRFSEAARRERGRHLEHWIELPQISGDFNDAYLSRDVEVLVIDKTRNGDDRFGIAIFNAPQDNQQIARAHWLFEGQDLSTAILGWSRDGLSVEEFRGDGTFTICHVRWDKTNQEYNCK